MAYKFQLGSAVISGSTTFKGDVEAGDEVKAVGGSISGSGQLISSGPDLTVTVVDSVEFGNASKLELRDGINNHEKLKIEPTNNIPAFEIKRSGSNTENIIKLNQSNVGANDYYLEISNESNVVGWKLNKNGSEAPLGEFSGSGDLDCDGAVSVAGDLEVLGALTVNGNLTALSGTLEIDSTVVLQVSGGAASDVASRGSGYHFGHLTNGGFITYLSGTTESKHIAIQTGDGSGIPLKALNLRGDGSNLSGITSTARYPLKDIDPGDAATRVCDKNSTNVIKVAPSGEQDVQLPTTGSGAGNVVVGDIVRIKLEATANETNRIRITGNGSDTAQGGPEIDGEQNGLLLMSPSASVDLIYLGAVDGTGSFAIF